MIFRLSLIFRPMNALYCPINTAAMDWHLRSIWTRAAGEAGRSIWSPWKAASWPLRTRHISVPRSSSFRPAALPTWSPVKGTSWTSHSCGARIPWSSEHSWTAFEWHSCQIRFAIRLDTLHDLDCCILAKWWRITTNCICGHLIS